MSFLVPVNERYSSMNRSIRSNGLSNSIVQSVGSSMSIGSVAQKDAKSLTFDTLSPLDANTAIDTLSNKNKQFFYQILVKFINNTLWKSISDIALALNKNNINRFKQVAHNLKTSAGYCGAVFIHYDCFFIQDAHAQKNFEKMHNKYNRLVENSIQFQLYT